MFKLTRLFPIAAIPLLMLAQQANALLTMPMPIPHPSVVRIPAPTVRLPKPPVSTFRELQNMGDRVATLGVYDEAELLYKRALRMVPAQGPDAAQLHDKLGSLNAARNDFEGAMKEWSLALGIYERIQGGISPSIAVTLNNIGWASAKLGRTAVAKDCFTRALMIEQKTGAPELLQAATRASLKELP
jgi:tetratricopeptide (TPR) repeat protein